MKLGIQTQGSDDWAVLLSVLPDGWRTKCKELGALRRTRKFKNAEVLLKCLLIHLVDGSSLRETAVLIKESQLATVSDVALLKRLKAAGEWFRWLSCELMARWIPTQPTMVFGQSHRIKVVDGSTIQEPGATGTTWRIHYAINLATLNCVEVSVTSPKQSESMTRYTVESGDVFLADRGYCRAKDIAFIVDRGGGLIFCATTTQLTFQREDGSGFPLIAQLQQLPRTTIGDWDVWITRPTGGRIRGRLCALKLSAVAAARAIKHAKRSAVKHNCQIRPETLIAAEYIFVFTTLSSAHVDASAVLEMYRGRWQIELVFKRLKSILSLGHLRKKDIEGSRAWINGKLFVAMLIEALIVIGESFFPWGYPLPRK